MTMQQLGLFKDEENVVQLKQITAGFTYIHRHMTFLEAKQI